MGYKRTMYMHQSVSDEKELLLLNTFNSKTIRAKGSKKEAIEQCLANPNDCASNEMFDLLKETEFIVDENLNEYQRAEKLYEQYRKNNKHLLHLIILPTEDCNFRCWYCYEEHNKGKMQKTMVDAIIRYVENHIEQYDVLAIGWFGGEPLKAFDVMEELSRAFMEICKKHGKRYKSNITTNGYLLSPKIFKKLLELEVREYQITLDGTQEVHDKNRYLQGRVGTYQVIVDNLKYIRDNFADEEFEIVLRTNISQDVYDVLEQHIKFLEEEFSGNHFSHIMKITWECGVKDCPEKQKLLNQTMMHEVLKKCRNSKLTFEMNMKQHFLFGQVCYASSKHAFVIGADGNIYKCTIHMGEKDSVGKLLSDGTMDLKSNLFCQWTTKVLADKEYKKCEVCPVYPICFGISCPNRNGDKVLTCPGILEYIDDYLRLFSCTEKRLTFFDYDLS